MGYLPRSGDPSWLLRAVHLPPQSDLSNYTPMALFLGLDLSTQSLKSTVSNSHGEVIAEKTINFHRDLPKYGTSNGAIAGPDDGEMTTPVALWIESLDIVMDALKAAGVDLSAVVAVSGAAQVGRALRNSFPGVFFTKHIIFPSNMVVSTWAKKQCHCSNP